MTELRTHDLTSLVTCTTDEINRFVIDAQERLRPISGGVDLPKRNRLAKDRFDSNDDFPAATKGSMEFNVANAAAKTCICRPECDKLGNVMYHGYSKFCHDLKDYQASRNVG